MLRAFFKGARGCNPNFESISELQNQLRTQTGRPLGLQHRLVSYEEQHAKGSAASHGAADESKSNASIRAADT